jgi:uncharacterized membrane protein
MSGRKKDPHRASLTDKAPRHRYSRLAQGLVWMLIVLYILFFASLSIRQHETFQTYSADLGNHDQAIWNTIHGRLFHLTNMAGLNSRLALHFEPILLPLSLSYLVYSDPRTLLVLQTVMVGLGTLPVFWLAREKLDSDLAALVFPLAYLVFPALEAANLFDFHTVTLAAPFLLYAFYFLQGRRYGLFALFAILAMSCKEDIPLLVAMLGLYIFVFQKAKKAGVLTFIGSGCWFYIAVFLISPRFSPIGQNVHLERYAYLGQTPQEMVSTVLTRPDLIWEQLVVKARVGHYLCQLLMPVAFTSLLSPQTFLISLPSLAINLLSQYGPMQEVSRYHYAAPLMPFVIISSVYGIDFLSTLGGERLRVPKRKAIYFLSGVVLVASLGYHRYRGFSPLSAQFQWPVVTEHHRLVQKFIDMIPPTASLSAQFNLNPHLSQRENIYVYPYTKDVEYVLLDVSSLVNKDNYQELIKTRLGSEQFGLLASEDGYLLLQRGVPPSPLPESFYTFIRVKDPDIQYPLLADFGSHIEFLGFDVIYRRDEEPHYNLYFRTQHPLDRDYFIALYLIDEAGQVVGSTVQPQPATVWYPTSRWQPGEVVKIRANTLPWWTGDREQYSVALGILDGNDTWDMSRRLRPTVIESEWLTPLPADGTLLQLMTFRNTWAGARPVLQERRFTVPEIEHPMEATLGDQVRFLGYDLSPPPYRRGETLHLTLYWQAMTRMEESYTVFVHLLNKDGIMGGQWDSLPGGGLLPTTNWLEGEVIADEYEVPIKAGAPPGEYAIEIGMYEASTGERLEVRGEGGDMEGNRIVLPKIQIPRGKE